MRRWSPSILIIIAAVLFFLPQNTKLQFSSFTQKFVLFVPSSIKSRLLYLRELKDKRDELEKKLTALNIQIAYLRNALKERANTPDSFPLWEKTEYELPSPASLVRANIIGRDHSLRCFLLIDKGKRDSVYENQPAVVPEGIVGKVIKAGDHFSVVETFHSPYLKIATLNWRTRYLGLISASGKDIKLAYIPSDCDLKVGDTLLTAGEGGIFPKGLIVGLIKKITPTKELFLDVDIQPVVDLLKIDAVYLITKTERKEKALEKTEMERIIKELELKIPDVIKIK